jgi:hypothetical protein
MFYIGGSAVPAAPAQSTQSVPAIRMREFGQAPADSAEFRALLRAQRCHDDYWYRYFPGAVNYCLGMRHWGKGSYRSALKLLKLAASWDNKEAQYTLGLIYYNGRHVSVDRARGIAWLMLATERHNDAQLELVARSAAHLATARQYRRAQQLFQTMRERYGDKLAGARAWRYLRNRAKFFQVSPPMPRTSCVTEGGDVVPWSSGLLSDPHVLCMPLARFSRNLIAIASKYFNGLTGTATVGPLQQVPGPASSSTR